MVQKRSEKPKRRRFLTPIQKEIKNKKAREYYALNKEERKSYVRKNYQKNRERILERSKRYSKERYSSPSRREEKNIKQRKYYSLHKDDKARAYQRGREKYKAERKRVKWEVLTHYGGNPPSCVCCGESIYDFLCLDHINGGGNQHRKKIRKFGNLFHHWILVNNFPDGFQVLCFNCNMAKGFFGTCPHKRIKNVSETVSETEKGKNLP